MPGFFERGDAPDFYELTPERRDELLDKIAQAVVKRNLTAPAVFFLESVKPLSFIGSQVMVFFDPLVRSVFNIKGYNDVRLALEDRGNLELLLLAIEKYDAQWRAKMREEKARRKTKAQ